MPRITAPERDTERRPRGGGRPAGARPDRAEPRGRVDILDAVGHTELAIARTKLAGAAESSGAVFHAESHRGDAAVTCDASGRITDIRLRCEFPSAPARSPSARRELEAVGGAVAEAINAVRRRAAHAGTWHCEDMFPTLFSTLTEPAPAQSVPPARTAPGQTAAPAAGSARDLAAVYDRVREMNREWGSRLAAARTGAPPAALTHTSVRAGHMPFAALGRIAVDRYGTVRVLDLTTEDIAALRPGQLTIAIVDALGRATAAARPPADTTGPLPAASAPARADGGFFPWSQAGMVTSAAKALGCFTVRENVWHIRDILAAPLPAGYPASQTGQADTLWRAAVERYLSGIQHITDCATALVRVGFDLGAGSVDPYGDVGSVLDALAEFFAASSGVLTADEQARGRLPRAGAGPLSGP